MPNPDRKDEIKLFRKHLAKKMRRNQEQRIEEDGLNEVWLNLIHWTESYLLFLKLSIN